MVQRFLLHGGDHWAFGCFVVGANVFRVTEAVDDAVRGDENVALLIRLKTIPTIFEAIDLPERSP